MKSSHCASLMLVLAIVSLGLMWIVFSTYAVPPLIKSAYRGESLPIFNRMIAGQASHPVSEYLSDWGRLRWQWLWGFSLVGLLVLLTRRDFRRALWGLAAPDHTIPAALRSPAGIVNEQRIRCPGLLASLGPPLLAFLLARVILWLTAAVFGFRYFDTSLWLRWDSKHYLAIAHGYLATSWMPGYPAIISFFLLFGVHDALAGVALSAWFYLLTLVLLWTRFLESKLVTRNILCLALAACFPGGIYYHAIFPISALTLFALCSIHMLMEERWLASGIAGATAAFTYATGFLLAPADFLWILYRYSHVALLERSRRIALSGGVTFAGLCSVFLFHKLTVGVWNAFFKGQAHWGYKVSSPLRSFLWHVKPLFGGVWPGTGEAIPALQTLFVAILIVLLIVVTLRADDRSPADTYLLIYVVIYWIFPLALDGALSLYRSESVLLPAVVLGRKLPIATLAALVFAAMLLFPLMALLFFRRSLI